MQLTCCCCCWRFDIGNSNCTRSHIGNDDDDDDGDHSLLYRAKAISKCELKRAAAAAASTEQSIGTNLIGEQQSDSKDDKHEAEK